MHRRTILPVLLSLLLVCLATPAVADDSAGGFLSDFESDFDGVSKKLSSLAEAIPAESWDYAPSDEVRTVSEALVHVAGANFFLAQSLGVPAPEELSPDMEETITEKDEVLVLLEKSQEHVRQAVEAKKGTDLDETLTLFGGERTVRAVFMTIAGHNHEHLGQLIAYARGSGVVPPWSGGGE